MTRFIVSFLLFCALSLYAAERKNYRILKSARVFAIGGVRSENAITEEETAFNALCKEPDSTPEFRRLLHEATIEGQMYALLGLRQLHAADYRAKLVRYRGNTRMVNTGSGCEIGPDKVSYVTNEWVDMMPLK